MAPVPSPTARENHPVEVMPDAGWSARLPGTPGASRGAHVRTVPAMTENLSLSAEERAELERLRAEKFADERWTYAR